MAIETAQGRSIDVRSNRRAALEGQLMSLPGTL
jgi:hypothetical protein